MKRFDLIDNAKSLAKSGTPVEAIMSTLTMKAYEHYLREEQMLLCNLLKFSGNQVEMNVQIMKKIDFNSEEFRKYGLKEREDSGDAVIDIVR